MSRQRCCEFGACAGPAASDRLGSMNDGDTSDDFPRPLSSTRGRWWLWGGVVVMALLLVGAGGFYVWATTTPEPGPGAVAALESDELVRVIEGDGYTFQPTEATRVGFVLYPGGRVDPASYAAPAREIAEAGLLVVVGWSSRHGAVARRGRGVLCVGDDDAGTWAGRGRSSRER